MSFTVTMIGADGAGKTTVTRRLEASLPLPCRYLYMGVSMASSNRMLPTTRLVRWWKRASGEAPDAPGPPDPNRSRKPPRGPVKRLAKSLRGGGRFIMLASEEWYRQGLTWWHLLCGRVVLYDRHFFIDYYAYDIARPRTIWERLHGAMLRRLYPRPQLVLFLDAPGNVLFARKSEGSVALLDRRRADCEALSSLFPHFITLDATQALDAVVEQAREAILQYDRERTGQ